ncbi:hypothetical protein Tco_0926926 [Tanacetum coccineum]|uniref:Uncharacterized protein n=1 Tax=Tanacetum coccineum TaxID=301880 RepID=A0ABQ5DC00_9ASTR
MSIARVILFGMIPTTIPSTTPTVDLPIIHDDTPLIPTDTLTISPVVPTIPPIAPTIQYTSSFIYNESSDNDTPNSPPSQDPYEVTIAWWRSRVTARSSPPSSLIRQILPAPPRLPRRPAILLFLGQSTPVGRPYCIQPNMTPCDSSTTTSKSPSRKRCRSQLVPVSSPVRGALSLIRANLPQPPKRISDSDSMTDLEILFYQILVKKSEQRLQGHRITGVDLEVTTMTERINALEQDNTRLRGMLDVGSQRADRLQRSLSRAQRETMPTATRTGMTQDAINELIAKRVDEALKAYDAARNPETEAEIENEQQDDHVEGDVNNGNGNRNGNGNPNVNNKGVVPVARECTYHDFVKCQQLNFKGTEGVVGLTH